jgi:hypothetical protein
LALPSLLPTSLVAIAIAHDVAVAITVAIILDAVTCLPPLLPSLVPPAPLPFLWHTTLIANAITLFVPLALFFAHHPYCRCHRLAALALFLTALIIAALSCNSSSLTFVVVWSLTLSCKPPPTFNAPIAS